MAPHSNILIQNIEVFIRKHFRIRLYQGLLLAALLLISIFLVFNFVEYFSFLPGLYRKWIFFGYLFIFVGVVLFFILYPIWQLLRFRQQMSIDRAAGIIGTHFKGLVDDKLLNTIQLQELLRHEAADNDLLAAAIRQRTEELVLIPFAKAVQIQTVKKIGLITLIPVLAFVLTALVWPRSIQEPVKRIVSYKTEFEKPLPFSVRILNPSLEVVQNEDYTIEIEILGEEIPTSFFIVTDGTRYPMEKVNNNLFCHSFRKVGTTVDFHIEGGEFKSKNLSLEVRPKALLLHYEANVSFPDYMKRPSEKLSDFVYANLPVGSLIELLMYVRNTDKIRILYDSVEEGRHSENGMIRFNKTLFHSTDLHLYPSNSFFHDDEGLLIRFELTADEFPVIKSEKLNPEPFNKWHYFNGEISDDYGFTKLEAVFTPAGETGNTSEGTFRQALELIPDRLLQVFYFSVNLDSLKEKSEKNWLLYFEISDNDRVSGPKKSRSQTFQLNIASEKVLDSVAKLTEEQLDQRLEQALKEATELKKDVAQFNKQILQKKDSDWNDRQRMKQLMDRQNNLENLIDNLKQERQSLNEFRKENELLNERLLEKQQRIDDLLDKVIPDDIRKMMEELQQMLENINKDQMSEMLKKMELTQQEMEKLLDRNLSLLEQLKVEKGLNEMIDRLQKLSDKLNKNAEETMSSSQKNDDLKNQLNEIKSEFQNLTDQLGELKEKNQELDRPFQLENTDEQEKDINSDLDQAAEQLEKNRKEKSGKSQKNAAGKMSQMAKGLQMMMAQSEEDQNEEDITVLRFLLESLIRISKEEESIFTRLSALRRDDPFFVDLMKEQANLGSSFQILDDSLVALAKRQSAIKNFVFEETQKIKTKIGEAQNVLKDRNTGLAVSHQQYAMMSMNNLALMLAESLKNMEENTGMPSDGQGQGKGKGKGKNAGKSLQNMRELQEALGKQLKDAMQGKQPSGSKTGMSEGLARMAAQQEALRNELKKIMDGLKSESGSGDDGLNKVLQDMEKFEEQLVNKNLNQKLLDLNQEIVVRLLESEKAQKEREQEERRESNEFRGKNSGNLNEIPEYKRTMEKQNVELRLAPIHFKPFYKTITNSYMLKSK